MAKQANQKLKALILRQILLEQSDETHPLTVPQLIDALAQWGIHAERKSVYADLEALAQFGLDVQNRKGKASGWFVGQRPFELAELKLLVDAVQSSKFITGRKSDALIRKLEGLASSHQARQLQRQVYVDRRVKTMNESIYYNVDKLHTALDAQRMVTFKYFDYNMRKEKAFRRGGGRYTVSPYGLVWDNENYYLVGHDAQHREMRHYRVDKMAQIAVTCLPRQGADDFNLAAYAGKHFGMFSGTEGKVTLRCGAALSGVVLDRFGQEVMLTPDGEEFFTVTLDVVVSPQFLGWLFALGTGVELVGPAWAKERYLDTLTQIQTAYGS